MRLLILTQKIDSTDSVLGFMHEWIRAFSNRAKVVSICLEKGKVDLPGIAIHSLGKEDSMSRFQYVYRFFTYIWKLRNEYDGVYVHMNKEYVVLGSLLWKVLGKKVVFSYNHPKGDWMSRLAFRLADTIFYTSPFAYSAQYPHAKQMSAGIDTEVFKRDQDVVPERKSVFTVTRISPIKYIDVLIRGFEQAYAHDDELRLNIYGNAPERDEDYLEKIKKQIYDSPAQAAITVYPAVQNSSAPGIYNSNELFVNLTPTGSLDKTVLEAMACETPVLVSNKAFLETIPKSLHNTLFFEEGDVGSLSEKISDFYRSERDFGTELRERVMLVHSLDMTVETILNEFNVTNG